MPIAWSREDPKALLPDDSGLQPGSGHAHAIRNRYFEELARDDWGGFRLLFVHQNALVCLPSRPQRSLSRVPKIPGQLSTLAVLFSKSEPDNPNRDIFNGLLVN